jgi:hypothetical protein
MVTNEHFRELALSFEDAAEMPHFEKPSFRVRKKIFATLNNEERIACVKLTPVDQDIFSRAGDMVYAVPNKWGKQGWTFVDLKKVRKNLLKEILFTAFSIVAKKKK